MTTKTYFIDSDNLYYTKRKRDSNVTQMFHIKSINLQTEDFVGYLKEEEEITQTIIGSGKDEPLELYLDYV